MAERSEIFNRLTDPPKKRDTAENRAQSAADFVLGAIRGAVKSVTTDLPGFLLDAADQLAGEVKSFGEKDRSEQMFSAITGTKKGSGQAETVGSFVNPIAATQAMILPAFLTRNLKTVKEAQEAFKAGESAAEITAQTGVFKLPDNIDDGILRAVLDPRNAKVNLPAHGKSASLEEVLDFPELYAAIPPLRTGIVRTDLTKEGAMFDPRKGEIVIGSVPGVSNKELIGHETQHFIQSIIGMNPGSAPEQFLQNPDRLNAVRRMADSAYGRAISIQDTDAAQELLGYRQLLSGISRSADSKYMRTAGEAEARAVESMIALPASEAIKDPLSFYGPTSALIKSPGAEKAVDADLDMKKLIERLMDLKQQLGPTK